MLKAKWLAVLLTIVLVVGGGFSLVGAQQSDEDEWLSLTPAEIEDVQQTMLAGTQEPGCPQCKATGEWDSNWEAHLNSWSEGWGYQTLKDGKINPKSLGQMGYVYNGVNSWVIITDADPAHPAEWLTLSREEILVVQEEALDSDCPHCQITGGWDSNWEAFLNDWTAGWKYRTLSGGRLNSQCLGQLGFVANVDGKWMIQEDRPNPGEGGGWVTLTSADSLKVQQALQGHKPDRFGAPRAIGAWNQEWADALYQWGQSEEWKPANWDHPQEWRGIELLNERRVAPALLNRLEFSLNEAKVLVGGNPAPSNPADGPTPAASTNMQTAILSQDDLAGPWSASLTIFAIIYPPDTTEEDKAKCEEQVRDGIGRPWPLVLVFQPTATDSGTALLTGQQDSPQGEQIPLPLPYSYQNGVVVMETSSEQGTLRFEGRTGKRDGNRAIEGTWAYTGIVPTSGEFRSSIGVDVSETGSASIDPGGEQASGSASVSVTPGATSVGGPRVEIQGTWSATK